MTTLAIVVGAVDRPSDAIVVRSILDTFSETMDRILVFAPPGAIATEAERQGFESVVIDDLEPLATTTAAARSAQRRAARAARRHRARVRTAHTVIIVGPEALPFADAAAATAHVAAVLLQPALGSARRSLSRHRHRVDVVAVIDPRAALGLGPVPPEVVQLDAVDVIGSALDAALSAPPTDRHAPAIVLAVPDYFPSLGGTTRQAHNQATGVRTSGGRAVVVTQRIERRWPRRQRVDRVDVVRLGPASRHRVAMKLFVARAALWMRANRDDIDVVNAVMYPDLAVSAALAGLGERSVICWAGLGDASDTLARSGFGPRRLLVEVRRSLLRHASHVALTPAIADELRAVGIHERVQVIPIPIDLDRFRRPTDVERRDERHRLGLTEQDVAIVYVGQLRALKRVDRLIEAFADVHKTHPHLRLFVVGGSRDDLEDRTDELRALAHSLGISQSVSFTGFTDAVEPFLRSADIFVLPSDREGLSNSLLEAMASGIACIAPASAGGDQVLTPDTGIVPVTNQVDDLITALRTLLDDPQRRHRMGLAAAEAASGYSAEAIAERYRALYEGLVRGRTR